MAKNSFPVFKTGGGILKKVIGALIVLAILAFVVKFPTDAAGAVHTAKNSGNSVLDSLVEFFRSMSKG